MSTNSASIGILANVTIFLFRVQEHGGETIIPFSCAFEQKLVDMPADEAAKYCAENQTIRQVNIYQLLLACCLFLPLNWY